MRFIHSADWQLGARFRQFGDKSASLRQERVSTLRRTLQLALDRSVDALIIAGDLFEDNQVDDSVISSALSIFADFGSVRVFILPGNHDPYTGPDSIWDRPLFRAAPPNVTVFREPKAIQHGGAYLIGAPLTQKVSTIDPTLKLIDLAKALPTDAIKVGISHGALAIPGKHQPNDFPIDLMAASRAALSYLAIGHWHNSQTCDGGRLVMPGTPEPDGFDQCNSGCVALVEIPNPSANPIIERISVAGLTWQLWEFDFLNVDDAKQALAAPIAKLGDKLKTLIVRIVMTGRGSARTIQETRTWLEQRLEGCFYSQIVDKTTLSFTASEMREFQLDHPIIGEVLSDLTHLENLNNCAGRIAPPFDFQPITGPAFEQMLTEAKIAREDLQPAHFHLAKNLLLQTFRREKP